MKMKKKMIIILGLKESMVQFLEGFTSIMLIKKALKQNLIMVF